MSVALRSCLTINLLWDGDVQSVQIDSRPEKLGVHFEGDEDGPCLTGIPFLQLMAAIVSEHPERVPEILAACGLDRCKEYFGLVELAEPKGGAGSPAAARSMPPTKTSARPAGAKMTSGPMKRP